MEWNGVSIEIQRSKLFLVLAMEMLEPASRGHNCPLCGGGGHQQTSEWIPHVHRST